jgi:hypothetical protein
MDEFVLTPVERRYQQLLDQMTGSERVQRLAVLCQNGWDMIALQVRQQYGDSLSPRELKYRIAERMYMGDTAFLGLMKRVYEQ